MAAKEMMKYEMMFLENPVNFDGWIVIMFHPPTTWKVRPILQGIVWFHYLWAVNCKYKELQNVKQNVSYLPIPNFFEMFDKIPGSDSESQASGKVQGVWDETRKYSFGISGKYDLVTK